MQGHLNQALHNHTFVIECCASYPDNFFDWKITGTFYTALHLLRAFCENRGVNPGKNHSEIRSSLNPSSQQITPFKPHAWKAYNKLQNYSEIARYDVFLDAELENEIQRDNFEESKKLLKELQGYFNSEGVKFDEKAA
jgi:hypothetical protein